MEGRGGGEYFHVKNQNFFIIYGTPPGNIVKRETDMVYRVADIMTHRYDKKFLVLSLPEAFNHLYSGDAVFETAASSTI